MEALNPLRRLRSEAASLRDVFQSRRGPRIASLGLFLIGGLLVILSIGVDTVRYFGDLDVTTAFSLSQDGSISEYYGYFVSATSAVLLFAAFLETRVRAFLFVSLVYGFVVLDDSLQYHERLGGALASSLGLSGAGGLRAQDLGELLAWAIAALVLVPLLVWCLSRRTPADVGVYLVYGVITLGLAFFAVGVDILDIMIKMPSQAAHVANWIEDGGELIMMCCAAVCAILYQQGAESIVADSSPVSARG